MSQPRMTPQPSENWGPEVLDALSVLRPPGAPVLTPQERAAAPRPQSNIIGLLSWHPDLAKAWFLFNNHIFSGTISARHREMATVRISWLRKGEYEWAQHVRMAKGIGMSDEEVDAITEGPDAKVWGDFDRAFLRAVDQLAENHYIEDDLWTTLSAEFDRQQMMDFIFTVGCYDVLCTATNNFGLGLDPGLEGFPKN